MKQLSAIRREPNTEGQGAPLLAAAYILFLASMPTLATWPLAPLAGTVITVGVLAVLWWRRHFPVSEAGWQRRGSRDPDG